MNGQIRMEANNNEGQGLSTGHFSYSWDTNVTKL